MINTVKVWNTNITFSKYPIGRMCSKGNYANILVTKFFDYSFIVLTGPDTILVPVPRHTMD